MHKRFTISHPVQVGTIGTGPHGISKTAGSAHLASREWQASCVDDLLRKGCCVPDFPLQAEDKAAPWQVPGMHGVKKLPQRMSINRVYSRRRRCSLGRRILQVVSTRDVSP